jgi:O-antigen/teichoic acid export membrane protein
MQGILLTSRATLVKSILINFATKLLPLVIGFTCVPFIIKYLGNERFGVLTLIWAVIGYSTVLDMGLGRALTQHIASKIGENDTSELPTTIITSIISVFTLGAIGSFLLWFFSSPIVHMLNVSESLSGETLTAIRIVVISLPFLIGNIMVMGVFEAYQKFAFLNKMNWPIVFANFIAPYFILPYFNNLSAVVIAVLISRAFVFIVMIAFLSSLIPEFFKRASFNIDKIKLLFGNSKWVGINSVNEGIASLVDRFFVSSLLGASVVAFLTTPSYALGRFSGFVNSAINVMFPAFSTEFIQNPQRCRRIYFKAIKMMAGVMIIPFLLIALFSKPLLTLWLGRSFAEQSYLCLSFYSVVFYFRGIGSLIQSFIDASGNMKTSCLIHVITLPLLLLMLLGFIGSMGIIGAPIALAIREFLCMCLKVFYAEKYFAEKLDTSSELLNIAYVS